MRLAAAVALAAAVLAAGGCGGRDAVPAAARATAGTLPDGVYRTVITRRALRREGLDVEEAWGNAGVNTLTFARHRFTADVRNAAAPRPCRGDLHERGATVLLVVDAVNDCGLPGRTVLFSARWTLRGGVLRFARMRPADHTAQAVFGPWAWRRIR